jgi:hypothetical protein
MSHNNTLYNQILHLIPRHQFEDLTKRYKCNHKVLHLLQALGAYGFLSKTKGKQYFLKFVPEALRLLREDILLSKEEYPELYTLVTAIP